MSVTVPPVAHRTLCVDFDGTLFKWGPLDGTPEPFEGAVEAVRAFRDAGFRIVIFTSRMSPAWWISHVGKDNSPGSFGTTQRKFVLDALRLHGVPYDLITAEKIPAEYYIDDRAIEFTGDWASVQARVLGGL